ncbi:hypothetical protein PsAD2_04138 [Pseudovibrio axinellae]|uniref:Uncharacterized protein n=1 Tax=Pseudovibrio axinellae TaxID=989403 RepID=A0A161V013_9HYPH|nr:hypothetical protein [Pseudovibrio axinellae]KZL08469.1 hypothetical protein PsAD2_04138 [Pseudovibrio axinellae]SEP75011.1 hypothetical protein SAMN05421798_101304 [Pseudovibrio axinellae]
MAVHPVNSFPSAAGEDRSISGPSAPKTSSSAEPFSLGEFIDIINPLQHIPGVNTLYRELTGDEASVRSRIAGSSLYGMIAGPLGVAGLVAGNIAEMKLAGKLDAESMPQEVNTAMSVIEQKLNLASAAPEPAVDMATPLQRGTPILPVKTGDIPPLFGNIASAEAISMGSKDKLIEALAASDESDNEAKASELPTIDKLSQDARNLLPEDLLRQLQERHRNTIAQS